jgi:hypothetical protein
MRDLPPHSSLEQANESVELDPFEAYNIPSDDTALGLHYQRPMSRLDKKKMRRVKGVYSLEEIKQFSRNERYPASVLMDIVQSANCPQSVIHSSYLVLGSIEGLSLEETQAIVTRLLRRCAWYHVVAGIESILNLFLYKVEQTIKEVEGRIEDLRYTASTQPEEEEVVSEADAETSGVGVPGMEDGEVERPRPLDGEHLQKLYIPILRRLGEFTTIPSYSVRYISATRFSASYNSHLFQPTLPYVITDQVNRVTQHLFESMDRLPISTTPGSSTKSDQPSQTLLNLLFQPGYFSPDLMDILMERVERHNWLLTSLQWHMAFLHAVRQGNLAQAIRYREKRDTATDLLLQDSEAMAQQLRLEDHMDADAESEAGAESSALARQVRQKARRAELQVAQMTVDATKDLFAVTSMESDFVQFFNMMKPYLQEPSRDLIPLEEYPDAMLQYRYAWSILLTRVGQDKSVETDHVRTFYRTMPPSALCAHTLTPVINGLNARRAPKWATEVWQDALTLEAHARDEEQGRYVNNYTIAEGVQAVAKGFKAEGTISADGLVKMVRLVDRLGRRHLKPDRMDSDSEGLDRIQLDSVVLNTLLHQCSGHHQPVLAFKLWYASRKRWGIYADHRSLGLILQTAHRCEVARNGVNLSQIDGPSPSVFTRISRSFSTPFQSHSSSEAFPEAEDAAEEQELYDSDALARMDIGQLVAGHQDWVMLLNGVRPWRLAKKIFRQVVIGNWPWLKNVENPLDLKPAGFGYLSFYSSVSRPPDTGQNDRDDMGPDNQGISLDNFRQPYPQAKYPYVIPNAATFHEYILILGSFNQVEEIPLALNWMKLLGIEPTYKCQLYSLAFVREVQGEPKRVLRWYDDGSAELVTDEDILRRWLEDWLLPRSETQEQDVEQEGESEPEDGAPYGRERKKTTKERKSKVRIPTAEAVVHYRRSVMQKGGRLILPTSGRGRGV